MNPSQELKKKGLYVILACYSSTRWIADHYDSDTFYYIADGCIIGLIGLFLYLNSSKDSVSKVSFALMLALSFSQIISETHAYLYNGYIRFLPLIIGGVTILELYKYRGEIREGITWVRKKWGAS